MSYKIKQVLHLAPLLCKRRGWGRIFFRVRIRTQIEIYRRDDERWVYITLDANDPVYFSCLDLELSMEQVYEDVL